MSKPGFLNWEEIDKELGEQNARISDSVDMDKVRQKAKEEFERGVRLGWHDAEGNSLLEDDPEDDDEGEDE